MRCKNCGANYRSKELFCPYCKTPNPRGLMWQRERHKAEQEYTHVKDEVLPQLRLEAANRILNRLLAIEAALAVLFFISACIVFALSGAVSKADAVFHRDEIEEEFLTLYEQERFGELYARLDDTDLFGEEYYEYSQMSLLYYDYEDFCEARMHFFTEKDAGSGPDEYEINRLIREMNTVLKADIPTYPELTKKNRAYHAQYCADVLAFAQTLLGMDDSELTVLAQDYITVREEEALTAAILAREAWL